MAPSFIFLHFPSIHHEGPVLKASLFWLLGEEKCSENHNQGKRLGSWDADQHLEKTQRLYTNSLQSSQVAAGAGLQERSAESDLPAPASEKLPELEGRSAARPYYCLYFKKDMRFSLSIKSTCLGINPVKVSDSERSLTGGTQKLS